MGRTKAQLSFRTGWARPLIYSGIMLAMLAFSTPIARSAAPTRRSLREQGEQRQVVGQVPGDEEVPADVLTPGGAHASDQLGIAEEMPGAEGRAFDGLHRVAGDAEDDLDRNPAGDAADDGLALPHGGSHVDPEAARQRLVNHDGGSALERVHLRLWIGRERDDAHVGIVAGRLLQLRQHVAAAARRRARQHEPDVVVLLDEPVGVDHAERVVRAVEPTDLEEEGLVPGNAQPVEMNALFGAAHVAVSLGERVHGRVDDEPPGGERRREYRMGKDHRVIALGAWAQDIPELGLRGGEIVVIAPEPPCLPGTALHQEEWSGVVDHHEIGVEPEALRIVRADVMDPPEHRVCHDLLRARERPGDRARDPFEVARADRDLPARVDTKIVEDRDQAVEDFYRQAPVAGVADVNKPAAAQALADPEQEIDGAARGHLPVVIQPRRGDGQRHRPSSSSAAVSIVRWRSRIRSRLPPYGSMPASRSATSGRSRAEATHSAKSLLPGPGR